MRIRSELALHPLSTTSLTVERTFIHQFNMPPTKRKASSSVSAPKTPQTPNKSATQNKSTPKSRLLAGNLASKRKATASLNQIAGSSQKKVKTTQATKGPPKEKDSAHARNEPAEEDYASTPFTIDCPAKPPKKNDTADDVYRGTDGADLGLEVAYAVRPGRWADMKSYGTLKCKLAISELQVCYVLRS